MKIIYKNYKRDVGYKDWLKHMDFFFYYFKSNYNNIEKMF